MMYIAKPTQTSTHAPSEALFIEADTMDAANKYAEKKVPGVKFKVREASKPESELARDMNWFEVAS